MIKICHNLHLRQELLKMIRTGPNPDSAMDLKSNFKMSQPSPQLNVSRQSESASSYGSQIRIQDIITFTSDKNFLRLSEYDPAYQTPHFSNASPMHLQSSSVYSDTLCIGLHMLCNSALPPASVPPHMSPPLVCLFVYLCHQHTCCLFCLFVSPSRLVLLIDGQWTSAKSDCTHSIRRGLGRRLSSLLLNSSPSTSRDHPLVT